MKDLILKIVTPEGALTPVECDSVHLTVCDNQKGIGGGSYGIKKGHIEPLFSLGKGEIKAFLDSQAVFSAKCGSGFANVKENTVTAVVEACEKL